GMGCEGMECGMVDDGMGGMLDCGVCPGDEECLDGVCVPLCVPAPSCEGAICGNIDDGCGGTLFCGTCPAGKTCDQGVCVDACVPGTCGAVVCGPLADGCGGTLDCGTCSNGPPGGFGPWNNQCISGACVCVPDTACEPGVCGTISDGCWGSLSCGACPEAKWPAPGGDGWNSRRAGGDGALTGYEGSRPGIAWDYALTGGPIEDVHARLADVDGDGKAEVLVARHGRLRAFAAPVDGLASGRTLWDSGPLGISAVHGVYDMKGDGGRQVLALGASPTGRLWLLDGPTGEVLWRAAGSLEHLGFDLHEVVVADLEIDFDPGLDILWSVVGDGGETHRVSLHRHFTWSEGWSPYLGQFDGGFGHGTAARPDRFVVGPLVDGAQQHVAVTTVGQGIASLEQFVVLEGGGLWGPTSAAPRGLGGDARSLYLVDANGDGPRELVATTRSDTGGDGIGALDPSLIGSEEPPFPRLWACVLDPTLPGADASALSDHGVPPADLTGNGRLSWAVTASGTPSDGGAFVSASPFDGCPGPLAFPSSLGATADTPVLHVLDAHTGQVIAREVGLIPLGHLPGPAGQATLLVAQSHADGVV
ncbi:MAG: VCBS repeat-containing protein, partial [Myxococcota bacterium]|nr:VCBS repeat-containing protein [Myxococcota bacterium]